VKNAFTRQELIELIEKVRDPSCDENEAVSLLQVLSQNVPHPGISGLIFWPEQYGLSDYPTAEEILEQAMNYKPKPPIQL
jgi:hypothetical protein